MLSHTTRSRLGLAAWIVLCVGGGAAVGLLTPSGDSAWYRSLQKPSFNPPSWIFAPVWTSLYLLMGIAAWRVWDRGGWLIQERPIGLFVMQLAVNFIWSFVFFSFQRIDYALMTIALLWVLIALTIYAFSRVDRLASWLLTPYLAWVSFATVLNFSLLRLN